MACAGLPDAEQDSLCRRVIPAVIEGDAPIIVQGSLSGGAGNVGVRFTTGAAARERWLVCRFAGSGFGPRKRELVGVTLDGAPFGPSALYFITSGWLPSQDSVAAEPPAPLRPAALRLPPGPAYLVQQALSALPKMGIYALLAASYALIYGLIGRILLSFGAFAALGGISTALAVLAVELSGDRAFALGLSLGLVAAAGTTGLAGFAAARLVVAPLARRAGTAVLVASAGLALAMEEGLRLAQGANTLWLAPSFNTPLVVAASDGFNATVTPMALAVAGGALAIALGLGLGMARSAFGRGWRALADDPLAAELFGVPARRMIALSFALAAGLAGLAGLLVTLLYGGIGFAGGAGLGLTALIAAILGGIGSVPGAMLGGVLLGLFEAAWSTLLPIELKDAALFSLLAGLLILRPAGLLAGRLPGPMRV